MQVQFDRLVVIERVHPTDRTVIGFQGHVDRLVDRPGQHEAEIVIGMLADQDDRPGEANSEAPSPNIALNFLLNLGFH